MQTNEPLTGVLLEDAALSLEEMARACEVEPEWVVSHVQAGVLSAPEEVQVSAWRFRSSDLARAMRLASIERDFDADEQLAAMVIDLMDEVRRLRARQHALGIR
ncbi:MAG TPA: chaperone modulator CbpM [Telluria sp.]|jgi:chaperone modulatory protein CbpM